MATFQLPWGSIVFERQQTRWHDSRILRALWQWNATALCPVQAGMVSAGADTMPMLQLAGSFLNRK